MSGSMALFNSHNPARHGAVGHREFLDAMACLPAPVTVVTAMSGDGRPHGTTVSAVSSLSLDPPMLAVALDGQSSLLRTINSSGRFAVNVLSTGQVEVARAFASKRADRFTGVRWRESTGLPRLEGVVGWLVASLDAIVPGGDHRIVIGSVEEAVGLPGPPLIYAGRQYVTHTPLNIVGDPGGTDLR